MEEALVFYPAPLIGHIIPTIELCKRILTHQPSLSISILITTAPPFNTDTSQYITAISATIPSSITFHDLPTVTLSPTLPSPTHSHKALFETLRLNTQHVHQALLSISKTHTIQALIMDFFCYHAFTIASQLNLPSYYFFTCNGSSVAFFLHFPTIHRTTNKSLRELNTHLVIPGVPPISSWDVPKVFLERTHPDYEYVLHSSVIASKTRGVIVNTFEAIEPRSLKAISEGSCIPNGATPPIFYVGPLVATHTHVVQDDECMNWLNMQPRKSVVFLCFGSMGVFSKEQLHEIACGLERSGQRFLWVVRKEQSHEDLATLMPEGFLDRTKERGLVVKNWAPQVEVLNHDSVDGFVSHCGWNSVLEALCAGVPMVAWPLYAEQRFNRVLLVHEIGVALWMRERDDESGFVEANEVEERVRELMESEKGEMVRKRVMVAKDEAKAALLSEHGSSHVALANFLRSWKTYNNK